MSLSRLCPACGTDKPLHAFKKVDNSRPAGFYFRLVCNQCTARAWYLRNQEKVKAKARERNKAAAQIPFVVRCTPEQRKARAEKKRLERIRGIGKRPSKHDAHVKAWAKWCKEQKARSGLHDAHVREWKSDDARIARWKTKYLDGYRLNVRMRVAIRKALRGNKAGRRWEQVVGYSLADLQKHFSKMLPKGKTIDGVLEEGWHIDHIVPKSTYQLSDERELAKAWCMSNLRLVPAGDNLSKGKERICLI